MFSVSAVCVASSELSAFPNQNGLGPCMSQSGRDWGREGVELLGAAAEGKRAQQTQASTQQAGSRFIAALNFLNFPLGLVFFGSLHRYLRVAARGQSAQDRRPNGEGRRLPAALFGTSLAMMLRAAKGASLQSRLTRHRQATSTTLECPNVSTWKTYVW